MSFRSMAMDMIQNLKFYNLTYLTGLDAVLHAVQLPARIAHLDPGLADVDADALPHLGLFWIIHGKLLMFLAEQQQRAG